MGDWIRSWAKNRTVFQYRHARLREADGILDIRPVTESSMLFTVVDDLVRNLFGYTWKLGQ